MATADTTAALELSAIDGVTAVLNKVQGGVDRLRSSYEQLGSYIKTLAGAIGVGMFASWIESTIDAVNHLRELSIQTGVAVETLSALKRVAKDAGTDLDSVSTMVQRLSKNMFEFAETGKGKAAQAFERLGYTQEQVKAGMQDMNSFLPEFAKHLLETGTATEQVAMAQFLMGRSGAQALPFLHELAEKGALVAKVTSEQAEQAHQYKKALNDLEAGGNALKLQMAFGLVPSLLQVLNTFNELKGKQGDFREFFETIGQSAKWLAGILGSIWLALKDMGDAIGARAAQAAALMRGDFAAVGAINRERDANYAANEATYNAMWGGLSGPPPALPPGRASMGALGDVTPKGGRDKPESLWTPQMEEMYQARRAAGRELEQMYTDEARAAEKARLEAARYDAQLENQAEQVRQLIDPTRRYAQEIERVNALVDANKLSEDEASAAIARYLDQMEKATAQTKAVDDIGRQLGLTFSSAFEDAILKGKGFRDILQGIIQDIGRLILRKQVTGPAAAGISGLIDGMFGGSSKPGAGGVDESGFQNVDWEAAAAAAGRSFDVGSSYVPRSGLAYVHQGERITPAGESDGVTIVQNNNYAIGLRGEIRAELAMHEKVLRKIARDAVSEARDRGGR